MTFQLILNFQENNMLTIKEKQHYSRQLLLSEIGEKGQEKLKSAKVLVIGAGGLGCPVLSYLTAAGIGHIGIIDSDSVQKSNLHRQVLFAESQIGMPKVEAAISRLKDQNSHVKFTAHHFWLTNQNALELIGKYDFVVDATDNFPTRYLINDACVILNKPFVLGSIDRFQRQVSVLNFINLAGEKEPTYRCLFPNPPSPEVAPNCAENGVLGVLPGIIGSIQANETIKAIVGFGDLLSGKLLMMDCKTMLFQNIKINRSDKDVQRALELKNTISQFDYGNFCGININKQIKQISAKELSKKILRKENLQLIDVRSNPLNEGIVNSIPCPLSSIKNQDYNIDKTIPTIVYCEVGITSLKAAKELQNLGFTNILNLKNGLVEWYKNESLNKEKVN